MKQFSKECIADLAADLEFYKTPFSKDTLDQFLEKFYQVVIDEYASINHDQLREGFEDMLLDTWRYSKINISEVDDGLGEYIDECFEEKYWKLDTLDKCQIFLDSLSQIWADLQNDEKN